MSRMPTPGSLKAVLTELERVGKEVSGNEGETPDGSLTVFGWKPANAPNRFPALWHWLQEPPPPTLQDQNRLRVYFNICAYIGVRHSDQAKDLERLVELLEAYEDTVDVQLYKPFTGYPLNRTVTWAERKGARFVSVAFGGGIEVVAAEIPLVFWLDRSLVRTN